jgi:hypothetical protein
MDRRQIYCAVVPCCGNQLTPGDKQNSGAAHAGKAAGRGTSFAPAGARRLTKILLTCWREALAFGAAVGIGVFVVAYFF